MRKTGAFVRVSRPIAFHEDGRAQAEVEGMTRKGWSLGRAVVEGLACACL